MENLRFLHAADIHLDSPLHGLARYEGLPLDVVRGATRKAFDNLIETAINEKVAFVVLAGDLFDGDWKDMGTGLYFARSMGRLAKANVPVYIVRGNHDAASILTKELPLPPNVHVFESRKAHSFEIDALGVVLHGRSFPKAQVGEDLVSSYPAAVSGKINIGVLHTSLTGHPPHADYAPCNPAELTAKGYDYWALGHVHDHSIVQTAPYIVYAGNLQGRNIRETGVKGAMLVEISDHGVEKVEHIALDVLRWAECIVDCEGAASAEMVQDRIRIALENTHAEASDGLPVIARVRLIGRAAFHGRLVDTQQQVREDVRAIAAHIDTEFWIEKVLIETAFPNDDVLSAASDEFLALLAEAANSGELQEALATDVREFLSAVPQAAQSGPPLEAARDNDWPQLLQTAAVALLARLSQEKR